MVTETKLKRLEKKFIDIRNHKGGGQIVVKRDEYGRWCNLEGNLLTKKEVNIINKEREYEGKQLVVLGCWTEVKKLPKGMPRFG